MHAFGEDMKADSNSDGIIKLPDNFISIQRNRQFADACITEVVDLVQVSSKGDGGKVRTIAVP